MSGPIGETSTTQAVSYKELLARLVAFDTTSHLTNLPLVDFVQAYLNDHGVESQLIYDDAREKANLHALIGPAQPGGLGLSGHTDVVPVDGQDWTCDPFAVTERDGRLYGRGTTDMKGFLACVLSLVPELKRRELTRPVQILFSYDEEVGCTGVRPMIDRMGKDFPSPGAIIVGEPTKMKVVDAHKGPALWRLKITGRPAHSSMPAYGVNAISYAGMILSELERLGEKLERTSRDERFDPPGTTLQVTTIRGGSASNIIPAECEIEFGVRALPGFDILQVERHIDAFVQKNCLPKMRASAPEADISLTLENQVPPFTCEEGSPAVSLALAATGGNATHTVSYATEAGLFQDGGAPAVVCGPGDIAQAHTADEWIEESELEACLAFLRRLIDRTCG